MQKTPTKIHRVVVLIALVAALALCAFSCIAHKRVRPTRASPSVEELDALAKPHFDEAAREKRFSAGADDPSSPPAALFRSKRYRRTDLKYCRSMLD